MSGDPASLRPEAVARAVRSIVSEVLFVDEAEVEPDRSLIADLGAESIDFLDLVFRLEDVVGRRITVKRFDQWSRRHLAETGKTDVTVGVVTQFAMEEAGLGGGDDDRR